MVDLCNSLVRPWTTGDPKCYRQAPTRDRLGRVVGDEVHSEHDREECPWLVQDGSEQVFGDDPRFICIDMEPDACDAFHEGRAAVIDVHEQRKLE